VRRIIIIMAVVALVASSGGFFLAGFLSPPSEPGPGSVQSTSTPSANDMLGQRRPDFTLSDSSGAPVSASDLDGVVWLVNFWATWCAPCIEEMPMLSLLQQEYAEKGVKFVGIAVDDPDRAKEFAAGMAISYPVLVGQTDVAMTGRRYGNSSGMLPFSVLIDANGIIRWSRLGALDRDELKRQIIKASN
jgi:thiol-disulfide isomerase/thioredoxin